MPNIASILKQEIQRLARKEVKQQTATTRRAAVRSRQEITQLRRLVKMQERKIKALESRGGAAAEAQPIEDESVPSGTRFSARSVKAQRKRLKLSAQEYAKLVGVSAQTIYQWEQGKSRPRRSQLSGLVAARSLGRREALKRLAEMDQ